MTKDQRMEKFLAIDVYPVITESFCAGRTSVDVCAQALAGGARIIQLREKNLTKREMLSLARRFRELTASHQALLLINDHVDIALASQADGVHLGQDDLPLAAARALAPELILGISTHNQEEALLAEKGGADYINLGPVFPTATKGIQTNALGLEQVRKISRCVSLPYTVMGGITDNNLEAVLHMGARRIAMVTAITRSEDVVGQVQNFRRRILSRAEG